MCPPQPLAAADAMLWFGPPAMCCTPPRHRLREKTFLADAGLPVTPFRRVDSLEDLAAAALQLGLCPPILKTAGFGYDGKGQVRIANAAKLADAWQAIGEREAVLESFVDFERGALSRRGARRRWRLRPLRSD